MQLKLFLNSASELKNVNWRYGNLQPYAVAWIDSSGKCSTKVDVNNGENPIWNEKFTIPLPPTSHPETAILYIDIVHAKPAADTKPLVGSAKLPFRVALNEVRSKGKALFSLVLERPSGRPQGSLEIQIEMKDSNIIQSEPYRQQARNMPPQPQPQPEPQPMHQPQPQPQPMHQPQPQPQPMHQYQPQPQPQPQPMHHYQPQPQPIPQYQPQHMPQPQNRPQQINQFCNLPVSTRPGYPANSPQNLRPTLAQEPGNAMLLPTGRPQYHPVNQQSLLLGDALCTLAFGVNPTQVKRMMGSIQRIQASAFNRVQGANTGMVNNTGFLCSSNNATYGADPSAAQGYDNAGYDDGSYTMGASDDGTGADGQFSTDGGVGDIGLDMGGFDASALDLGGLDLSGVSM